MAAIHPAPAPARPDPPSCSSPVSGGRATRRHRSRRSAHRRRPRRHDGRQPIRRLRDQPVLAGRLRAVLAAHRDRRTVVEPHRRAVTAALDMASYDEPAPVAGSSAVRERGMTKPSPPCSLPASFSWSRAGTRPCRRPHPPRPRGPRRPHRAPRASTSPGVTVSTVDRSRPPPSRPADADADRHPPRHPDPRPRRPRRSTNSRNPGRAPGRTP